MSEQNDNKAPDKDPKKAGGDSNFNWRGFLLLSLALGLFGLAIWSKGSGSSTKEIPYQQFKALLQEDRIHVDTEDKKYLSMVEREGTREEYLRGWYTLEPKDQVDGKKYQEFKTPINLAYVEDELKPLLKERELEIYNFVADSNTMAAILLTFLPLFIIIFVLYFLFRHQMRAAGKGAMGFGKSKAKMMEMDKNKTTFKDVAGAEEAKEEVWEIVEYLRDPKKFQRLGGKIPKGVLLVGSPGTGKTLLARAIAGEADVPFFSISGSDFVEMFVGVGASRVRDMFEQGKKNAPCIIFIDEIDAVGRHRGHGMGGGHDEREQTLNALLVEMDGFDTQEGVIIIAATNRPDVLDPALLRPGRFDREVTVNLPDVKGREEILKVHAKKVKLAEGVDMGIIARGTPGYSGAELANLINEAALLAARRELKAITIAELEEARDKVRWGKERRSLAISEKEKENTAYHEAGHAILGMLVEHTDPVHKVTIIPRGPSLGMTMYLPEDDQLSVREHFLLDRLVVIMGGRVAEEIQFGNVTAGASGDIQQATDIARRMVCEWGMSAELGMVQYGSHQEHVFLARDMGGGGRDYSEATAQKIDSEVKRLIDTAYKRAMEMILAHRPQLELIAQGLLEYETLDGKHVKEIMEHGEIKNPPASPNPPELPKAPSDSTEADEEKSESSESGDLPGDLAPAGA